MKKRIFAIICLIVFCMCTFPVYTLAAESEEEIIKAWVYENGELTEITVDEYYELVNSVTYVDSIPPMSRAIGPFAKQSEYTTYLPAYQVSAAVAGPGQVFASSSVSVSTTYSFTIEAGISIDIIQVFSAQVQYTASSASGSSGGAIFNVPSGETGVVMFNPKVAVASGMYTYSSGTQRWLEITAPVVLSNGILDGIYFLKLI